MSQLKCNSADLDLDMPVYAKGVLGTLVCVGIISRVSVSQDLRQTRPSYIRYDVDINDDGIEHHVISSMLLEEPV